MHAVAGGDPFELLGTHFSVALASNRLGGWGPVPPVPFHAGGSGRGTVNEGGRVAMPSVRWDAEWARCISQERAEGGVRAGEGEDEGRKYGPCVAIKPGCLEGVWEGHFTVRMQSAFSPYFLMTCNRSTPNSPHMPRSSKAPLHPRSNQA